MMREVGLDGCKVLVVEDDYYLASDAAQTLKLAGAEVIGPCPTPEAAKLALARERPDAVLLDINLGAGPSFELAGILWEQQIPFVFVTGYDKDVIPLEFQDVERLEKPIHAPEFIDAITRALKASR